MNMHTSLYTSPAGTSGECFESNGLDPQLQFTLVTSRDLPDPALTGSVPHACHQFGYSLL